MNKRLLIGFSILVLLFTACANPFFPDAREKEKNIIPSDVTENKTNETPPITNAATPITSVSVSVTSPMKNAVPNTTAEIEEENANYSAGVVLWSPDHDTFHGEIVYTATVTLTADDDYIFANEIEALINGDHTTEITENTGDTITLSLTFAPTLNKEVISLTIKVQPDKLEYSHGDLLDLTGLVVTITYEDSSTEDVRLDDFHLKNISVNPHDGAELIISEHNGHPVVVAMGEIYANTDNLIVNKADPVVTWPTNLAAIEGKTLASISLPGNGTSTPAGTFTWVTPTTSVGTVGTRSFSMRFMPTDTTNYNTLTQNVNIIVRLIEMVNIPAGTFKMGSPTTEANRFTEENYRTANNGNVTLTGFNMGKYEVTQTQWTTVMGSLPSSLTTGTDYGRGGNYPVYCVSWYDTLVFCNRLSILEGLTPAYRINNSTNPDTWGAPPTISNATWDAVTIVSGSTGYRLPTEAQWEYACRAGTTTAYNTGNTISDNTGWYTSNSGSKSHEVGKKPANAWGLYDMHGNVREWCWDWFNASYDNAGGSNNPTGAVAGSDRVVRGGCWSYVGQNLRSALRNGSNPSSMNGVIGFRVVRPCE